MKAVTAKITINGRSVLKVLLQPETKEEKDFLEDAFNTCVDYEVSFQSAAKETCNEETQDH